MAAQAWANLLKALQTILNDHESGRTILTHSEAEYVANLKRRLERLTEKINVNDN